MNVRKIIIAVLLGCCAEGIAQECNKIDASAVCCKKKKASKREMAQLREDVVDQAIDCMEKIHRVTAVRAVKIAVDKNNATIIVSLSQIGLELVSLSRQLVDDERNSFVATADEQTLRSLLEVLVEINSASDKVITATWAQDREKRLKKSCCSDILSSK